MKIIKIVTLMMIFLGILSDENKIVKKIVRNAFITVDASLEKAGGNNRMGGGIGG